MKALQALGKAALLALGTTLTFQVKNVETKASKTGNVGFKATTDQGKVITFWQSNMDLVVEPVEGKEDQFQVIAGTQITEDGSLIPKGAAVNGFWA